MTYRVVTTLHFCYGHRLLAYEGKCRHLHGHNARVEVEIESQTLDGRGMACDFGDIRQAVGAWIDAHLDHRMILHEEDPLVAWLSEQGEPHHILPHNPTAENIARAIFEAAHSLGFPVRSVRLWETPHSSAIFLKA